jgi:hypothetical protein
MLHYPPDSMTASSMYSPTSNQSLFNLMCKVGIEELGAGSDVKQFGVLLFDVCPRKKSRNKYIYTRSHVPDHFRRYIRDKWAKSTARIGIVMGGVSEEAFLDVFQRRVRCVAKVDYNNKNDRLVSTNRVYFVYANTADMFSNKIQRVVFRVSYPEHFRRTSLHLISPSAAENLSAVDLIMAVSSERFFDAAVILAVGQVPRPLMFSHASAYFQDMSVGLADPLSAFHTLAMTGSTLSSQVNEQFQTLKAPVAKREPEPGAIRGCFALFWEDDEALKMFASNY